MSFKPVVSVLALALLAACGQDVTPPDNTGTGGDAATAPANAAATDVDPSRVDTAPGTAPTLVSEGDPGYVADASGAALYYLEGDANGERCDQALVESPVLHLEMTHGQHPCRVVDAQPRHALGGREVEAVAEGRQVHAQEALDRGRRGRGRHGPSSRSSWSSAPSSSAQWQSTSCC